MTALIVAIDTPVLTKARKLVDAVYPHCVMAKIGSEFFAAHGPVGVDALLDTPFMLDLKYHDIPSTVAKSVTAASFMNPEILTVHASGGADMIKAARDAVEKTGKTRPLIIAITVLSSATVDTLYQTGVSATMEHQVFRLAHMAIGAGADGLVCSPWEVAMLRKALPGVLLITPGVRLAGGRQHDQARTMTPREAAEAGSDYIVVGRPIAEAADPGAVAEQIVKEISGVQRSAPV